MHLSYPQKQNVGDAISKIQIWVNIHGLTILLDWCGRPSHCQALRDLTPCESKDHIPSKNGALMLLKERAYCTEISVFLKNVEILELSNLSSLL